MEPLLLLHAVSFCNAIQLSGFLAVFELCLMPREHWMVPSCLEISQILDADRGFGYVITQLIADWPLEASIWRTLGH